MRNHSCPARVKAFGLDLNMGVHQRAQQVVRAHVNAGALCAQSRKMSQSPNRYRHALGPVLCVHPAIGAGGALRGVEYYDSVHCVGSPRASPHGLSPSKVRGVRSVARKEIA